MSVEVAEKPTAAQPPDANAVLASVPHPLIVIGRDDHIRYANGMAEEFFATSASHLSRSSLQNILPFGSPLLGLVEQVRNQELTVSEYGVDLSTPLAGENTVDIQVSPMHEEPGSILVLFQRRSIANKMDRQLTHRGAARSVTSMAAVLAHEIKNPLSGIRGAAQLLDHELSPDDQGLVRLICDEVDRICKLVDRMEVFSDTRPVEREPINIHEILRHVRRLSASGFAKNIRFTETYDPSLPPVLGNRDQLIQVFLNLIKNAAEASNLNDGEISISTAYRPGVRLSTPDKHGQIALPLEVCIRDNGVGVPEDLMHYLFDPFVTTKSGGTGLGLALVAKIIGDHGGVVECEPLSRGTVFRILMPVDLRPNLPDPANEEGR